MRMKRYILWLLAACVLAVGCEIEEVPDSPDTPTPPQEQPEPEPKPEPEPEPEPEQIESYGLDAPLSREMIYSSTQLAYQGTAVQCFDFLREGSDIYYTQCSGDSTTGNKWQVVVSRGKPNEKSGEIMKLQWFGHGTRICVEDTPDGVYIWVNSNGTLHNGSYTNNLTFSRMKYVPGAVYSHYGGDTYYLSRYTDRNGKSWKVYDVQPAIDFESRRLLVGCLSDHARHNIVYDLDEVLSLAFENVSITRTWGGEKAKEGETTQQTTTNTVRVRNLERIKPLGSFSLPDTYLTVGPYTEPYSCHHQGHAVDAERIYWYEGLVRKSSSGKYDASVSYLEVFDYNGNRVMERQKVAALSDFAGITSLLNSHENLYVEAEGVQIKNGTLYLGMLTHIAGANSGNRLATILKYELKMVDKPAATR